MSVNTQIRNLYCPVALQLIIKLFLMKTLITLFSILFTLQSFGAFIKTAQKGNWNDGTTWVGGSVPQTGDSIWIDHHDTVTVTGNVSLGANTILVVDTSSSLVINPGRRIDLGAGSRFYLRGPSSQVAAGTGGGSAALIRINGTDVWSAGVQSNILGPACFPSGSVSWCGSVTLPVEYSSWAVSTCENSICLNWSTAWEENNSHFTILRSEDLIHFDAIATIKGAGNSNILNTYSFVDHDIIPGVTYYYQLEQEDFNGTKNYSVIHSSAVKTESAILISPVPAENELFFQFKNSSMPKPVSVTFTDMRGNVMAELQTTSENFRYAIPDELRKKGLIHLQIIQDGIIHHHKIILK
jgi:hypothetical protein